MENYIESKFKIWLEKYVININQINRYYKRILLSIYLISVN